jgi:hypothetical protein
VMSERPHRVCISHTALARPLGCRRLNIFAASAVVMRRIKTDVSMHFYFDAAAMAYRVVWPGRWRLSGAKAPGCQRPATGALLVVLLATSASRPTSNEY